MKDRKSTINTGDIVDTVFFRSISPLIKENDLLKKYNCKIVNLWFATRYEHEGTTITRMEKKESLSEEFFISVEPSVSFFDMKDGDYIVVEYDSINYVLPPIGEPAFVKRTGRREIVEHVSEYYDYLVNNFEDIVNCQRIKYVDGVAYVVPHDSQDYRDACE